jgi:hypothetical protein
MSYARWRETWPYPSSVTMPNKISRPIPEGTERVKLLYVCPSPSSHNLIDGRIAVWILFLQV